MNDKNGDVANELWHYISLGSANGGFDYSQNAVYLLIQSQGVTVTDPDGKTSCVDYCGYNNVATPRGARLYLRLSNRREGLRRQLQLGSPNTQYRRRCRHKRLHRRRAEHDRA